MLLPKSQHNKFTCEIAAEVRAHHCHQIHETVLAVRQAGLFISSLLFAQFLSALQLHYLDLVIQVLSVL